MDLSVASSLHDIKITTEQGVKSATLRSLVCMLVLVTTLISKIHGMARQSTVRRHVYEAKHDKSKFIGCMDH